MELLIRFLIADYTRNDLCEAIRQAVSRIAVLAIYLVSAVPMAYANPLPDTIDRVRPSIVAVGIYDPIGSPRQQFRGTGFVVGDGRFVITNAHVIADELDKNSKQRLGVFSGRGRRGRFHPVTVVEEDLKHDLAVLAMSERLPALNLAERPLVREGSEIAFTGFPLGMALGLYPVTHRGIVSAISPMAPPQIGSRVLTSKMIRSMRDPFDVLQLDATAYPGNSGSPVYDQASGKVVGVINSVLVKGTKEAAIKTPSGITYAIPVSKVHDLLRKATQ